MIKGILRTLILTVSLSLAFGAMAYDLPVKTINGKQYYYYTVKKGDTLYSLTNLLGITRKQLVDSNPSAADMLKNGDVLYFSVADYGDKFKPAEDSDEPDSTPAEVNGIIYHKVKKGETLYGIGRQYDISQEQILALNPGARLGVKAGTVLKIPAANAETAPETDAEADANPGLVEPQPQPEEPIREVGPIVDSIGLTPVNTPVESTPIVLVEDDEETVTFDADSADAAGPSSIAVLLPFMLDNETPSRQAQLYTDFYKGLMIAADTLSTRGDTVRIYAYDTMGDINRIKELLNDEKISGASVIIAPDDPSQLAMIAAAAKTGDTKVLNVFNIKDSLYLDNADMLQANIPPRRMYGKALDAIERYYPDYIPVIIRNESGRSDKAEFIAMLTDTYKAKGIEPIEIVYDRTLMAADLEALANDDRQYLIVPTSGSLAEFNRFSHAIKSLRDNSAVANRIALFGYPDWTAFRSDAEEMLHQLGVTIYSRFYYDERGFDALCLNEAFKRWFGEPMIEVVPNQGLLGFDVGNMLIRNIRNNDGLFVPDAGSYNGAQSSFRFVRPSDSEECGYYNDEIYILRFEPSGRVERLAL